MNKDKSEQSSPSSSVDCNASTNLKEKNSIESKNVENDNVTNNSSLSFVNDKIASTKNDNTKITISGSATPSTAAKSPIPMSLLDRFIAQKDQEDNVHGNNKVDTKTENESANTILSKLQKPPSSVKGSIKTALTDENTHNGSSSKIGTLLNTESSDDNILSIKEPLRRDMNSSGDTHDKEADDIVVDMPTSFNASRNFTLDIDSIYHQQRENTNCDVRKDVITVLTESARRDTIQFLVALASALQEYGTPTHLLEYHLVQIAKGLGVNAAFSVFPSFSFVSIYDTLFDPIRTQYEYDDNVISENRQQKSLMSAVRPYFYSCGNNIDLYRLQLVDELARRVASYVNVMYPNLSEPLNNDSNDVETSFNTRLGISDDRINQSHNEVERQNNDQSIVNIPASELSGRLNFITGENAEHSDVYDDSEYGGDSSSEEEDQSARWALLSKRKRRKRLKKHVSSFVGEDLTEPKEDGFKPTKWKKRNVGNGRLKAKRTLMKFMTMGASERGELSRDVDIDGIQFPVSRIADIVSGNRFLLDLDLQNAHERVPSVENMHIRSLSSQIPRSQSLKYNQIKYPNIAEIDIAENDPTLATVPRMGSESLPASSIYGPKNIFNQLNKDKDIDSDDVNNSTRPNTGRKLETIETETSGIEADDDDELSFHMNSNMRSMVESPTNISTSDINGLAFQRYDSNLSTINNGLNENETNAARVVLDRWMKHAGVSIPSHGRNEFEESAFTTENGSEHHNMRRLSTLSSMVTNNNNINNNNTNVPQSCINEDNDENGANFVINDSMLKAAAFEFIAVRDGVKRLRQIVYMPPLYSDWIQYLCAGIGAGGSAGLFFDGSWIDVAASTVLAIVVAIISGLCQQKRATDKMYQFISSCIVGFAVHTMKIMGTGICSQATIVSSVLNLLQTTQITLAMIELMTRNMISGSSRLVYAITITILCGFGLDVGKTMVEVIFGKLDDPAALADDSCNNPIPHVWYFVLFLPTAITYNIDLNAHYLQLPVMMMSCTIGFVTTYFMDNVIGVRLSATVGAFCVGLYSNIYSRWSNSPALIPEMAGLVILAPSGLAVRGAAKLLDGVDLTDGLGLTANVVIVGLCMGIGTFMVGLVAPPSSREARVQNLAYGKSTKQKLDNLTI